MNIIYTKFDYEYPLAELNQVKVKYIILHHAAIEQASAEDIHRWHRQKGFGGFGYNEYIRKDGRVFIGRGNKIGSHCKELNGISYGICLEGNYQEEKIMPTQQRSSLIERILQLRKAYSHVSAVKKHSDFRNTSCPGQYFPFQEIIEELSHKDNKEEIQTQKNNPFDEQLRFAIDLLTSKQIITDSAYWKRKIPAGELIKADYVNLLIQRMAEYILKK